MNNQAYAGDLMPTDAWTMLDENERAVLVDCRTEAEWRFVGVPDLAPIGKQVMLVEWQRYPDGVPNPNFVDDVKSLGIDADQPVLFLCRSGGRSRNAAVAMTAAGFGSCYNVAEGFEGDKDGEGHRGRVGGWKLAGLPWRQE
jgi:rhodanese-related sulfurtransferase